MDLVDIMLIEVSQTEKSRYIPLYIRDKPKNLLYSTGYVHYLVIIYNVKESEKDYTTYIHTHITELLCYIPITNILL